MSIVLRGTTFICFEKGCLKVLANEDTLLLMMCLGLRKLGNICCGHKMFLNKIRNIFCAPDTKFVPATNVARACKRETFVSATMCPPFARAFTNGEKLTDNVAGYHG